MACSVVKLEDSIAGIQILVGRATVRRSINTPIVCEVRDIRVCRVECHRVVIYMHAS